MRELIRKCNKRIITSFLIIFLMLFNCSVNALNTISNEAVTNLEDEICVNGIRTDNGPVSINSEGYMDVDISQGIEKIKSLEVIYRKGEEVVSIKDFNYFHMFTSYFMYKDLFTVGVWEFDRLIITDYDGNSLVKQKYEIYYSDIIIIDEFIEPVIKSFTVNKPEISLNEVLEVEIQFEDNGAYISNTNLSLMTENLEIHKYYILYEEITNTCSIDIYIDKSFPESNYNLVLDVYSGKRTYYFEMDSEVKITGTGSTIDEITPIIQSVNFDKEVYSLGDTINVEIDIDKKNSDIFNGTIELSKNSNTDTRNIYFSYDDEKQKFIGSEEVTEYFDSTYWYVSEVSVYNIGVSPKQEYPYTSIKVEGTNNKECEIVDVVVNGENKPTGFIDIGFKLEEQTEIKTATGEIVYEDDTRISRTCNFKYNEETGYYVTQIYINTEMPKGNYMFKNMKLLDWNNSLIGISKQLNNIFINSDKIYNEVKAPSITSVFSKYKSTEVGQEQKISVMLDSYYNNIKYLVLVYRMNDNMFGQVNLVLAYNDETGMYEKEFTVDNNVKAGLWELEKIKIVLEREGIYNSKTIDITKYDQPYMLSKGDFTVKGEENEDKKSLIIKKTWFENQNIYAGDTVKLYVQLVGDIDRVASVIVSDERSFEVKIYSDSYKYNSNTGLIEVDVTIPKYSTDFYPRIEISDFSGKPVDSVTPAYCFNNFDINYDNSIDIRDIAILGSKYNKVTNDVNYNTRFDLKNDGIIDIYDMVKLSKAL